uniref:DUF1985 domain-containing protein n=1 Tax=Brassica oleracea var. oleracea TaxID=109376 RepID=A0A0D3C2B8_BRAOL
MDLELSSRIYSEGLKPQESSPFRIARVSCCTIGLKVKQEKNSGLVTWKDDDGFWSMQIRTNGKINLQNIKKSIWKRAVAGLGLIGDEKVNIPHLYMKLVMDLEKLRNYPWGLYSFDFLLNQIDKTRDKLEQKDEYLMEGFLFGFQIWIMEVIPALGEICGTKGNLHSFMEFHRDGVVLLATDFARKDEKKEERADHIVDMIQRKHDWSNHVWGVKKVTSSEFEEADKEEGEDQTPGTEIGENSHVAENVDGTIDVSGRNKRKHADRGAESRKKKKFSQQFSDRIDKFETVVTDRLGKIETGVTQLRTTSDRTEQFETVVTDRLEKIEAEVTQLRTTVLTTELVGKSDQRSGPSKRKIDTAPSTSKKDTAPSKK